MSAEVAPETEQHGARCAVCGKVAYPDRRTARRARRRVHPGVHMRAYPCGNVWHFGHLPPHLITPPAAPVCEPLPSTAIAGITVVARATLRIETHE